MLKLLLLKMVEGFVGGVLSVSVLGVVLWWIMLFMLL